MGRISRTQDERVAFFIEESEAHDTVIETPGSDVDEVLEDLLKIRSTGQRVSHFGKETKTVALRASFKGRVVDMDDGSKRDAKAFKFGLPLAETRLGFCPFKDHDSSDGVAEADWNCGCRFGFERFAVGPPGEQRVSIQEFLDDHGFAGLRNVARKSDSATHAHAVDKVRNLATSFYDKPASWDGEQQVTGIGLERGFDDLAGSSKGLIFVRGRNEGFGEAGGKVRFH